MRQKIILLAPCITGAVTTLLSLTLRVSALDPCDGFRCPPTFTCHLDKLRRPVCRCGDTCSSRIAPVCASDGHTYRNECRMRLHACKTAREIHVAFHFQCYAGDFLVCTILSELMLLLVFNVYPTTQ